MQQQTQTEWHCKGISDNFLKTYVSNRQEGSVLNNVYYVRNIRKKFMSVSQIEKKVKAFLIKDEKDR